MTLNMTSTVTSRNTYLANKTLSELNLRELAYIHLNVDLPFTKLKDCKLSSRLYELNHALELQIKTQKTNMFLQLISAFAIAKQLSGLYSLERNLQGIDFIRCMSSFSELSPREISLLHSLKQSLLKDGSFAVKSSNPNEESAVFRLSDDFDRVVTPPAVQWNGEVKIDPDHHITLINTDKFRQLVINIQDKVLSGLLRNKIIMHFDDKDEFIHKYLQPAD